MRLFGERAKSRFDNEEGVRPLLCWRPFLLVPSTLFLGIAFHASRRGRPSTLLSRSEMSLSVDPHLGGSVKVSMYVEELDGGLLVEMGADDGEKLFGE